MSIVPVCPLCGKTKHMHKPKKLYGHEVCKKCVNGFANRRQIAWILDWVAAYILLFIAALILVMLLINTVPEAMDFTNIVLMLAFLGFMLAKDGFSGTSPGKALIGVKAVDIETGAPIGFGTSIKRNLPMLIPFGLLIMGMQLLKGKRWGDGWAHTKVIWTKYADNPVFNDKAPPLGADFGPLKVELPPVQETANPYQAPRH